MSDQCLCGQYHFTHCMHDLSMTAPERSCLSRQGSPIRGTCNIPSRSRRPSPADRPRRPCPDGNGGPVNSRSSPGKSPRAITAPAKNGRKSRNLKIPLMRPRPGLATGHYFACNWQNVTDMGLDGTKVPAPYSVETFIP